MKTKLIHYTCHNHFNDKSYCSNAFHNLVIFHTMIHMIARHAFLCIMVNTMFFHNNKVIEEPPNDKVDMCQDDKAMNMGEGSFKLFIFHMFAHKYKEQDVDLAQDFLVFHRNKILLGFLHV